MNYRSMMTASWVYEHNRQLVEMPKTLYNHQGFDGNIKPYSTFQSRNPKKPRVALIYDSYKLILNPTSINRIETDLRSKE